MKKLTGLNIIEELVEEEELNKKINKDIKNDKIRQLTSQGIDKEIAKVMVTVFDEYGIA